MVRRGFHPEEVLFSPTTECNLSCAHCDIARTKRVLSEKAAGRFLLECKGLGVKRVGFSGGEPFLALDFLCALTKSAVKEGFLFDRIMTNAVWWKTRTELTGALARLYNAGYDGSICVSVDAFHTQDIRKVAYFIETAVSVWKRPDVVSIAYTSGAKDMETAKKLRALERLIHKKSFAFVKKMKISLSPVGKAEEFKNPWDGKWFKEDRCKGPGNTFFVMPDGDVKPCCGYATQRKELTMGNIKRDSAKDIMKVSRGNRFIFTVFNSGLSAIRKALASLGVRFPGKTSNHCYFCNYILTKIPGRILKKCLALLILTIFIFSPQAPAGTLKAARLCREIPAHVVKKLSVPKWYHEGLFYDGRSIWLANGMKGKVWIIDTSSGAVTSEIEPIADFTEAITPRGDGTFYTTEWYAKAVYRSRVVENKIVPFSSASVSPAHPAGLVWSGKSLFVVTWTRGLGTKFDILEMDEEMKTVRKLRIRNIQEPDQLAWDGKYLWVSSWHSQRVYKVNIENWEVVGYFRSPVPRTTGIAWDGKYMWLTGTYGDLYQMDLGGSKP